MINPSDLNIVVPGMTNGQNRCINDFTKWWNKPFDNNNYCYSIIGSAGTGKTYLLNYLLNNIIDKSCCITAPTHKALRVLEQRCNRRGITLQSLHGLRPNIDMEKFDIKNPQFDPKGNPKMNKYSAVIIDECSMINKDLFELNKQRALQYKCRIIYCGDAWQIPPVNEQYSLSFDNKQRFILTDIVRQESTNPLMNIFSLIRNDIKNNTNTYLMELIKNRENLIDDKGYILLNKPDFIKTILVYYNDPKFYRDTNYFRTLGYTNARVEQWNNIIREHIIGKTEDIITINDLFTSNVTILDEYNTPIIINSEDYIVKSVDKIVSSEGIKCYVVVLISCFNARETVPLLILDHSHIDSYKIYCNICNELFTTALRNKNGKMWLSFFNFRKRILTLKSITVNNKEVKADIYYGYAITSHKAQGSTYSNVAIDLVDVISPISRYGSRLKTDTILSKQLAYVAMSRARNKCIIQY